MIATRYAGVVLGALALVHAATASAAPSTGVPEAQAAPSHWAAVTAAARTPLIQGVVVDQLGRPVDDVTVEADRANGEPAASALTYASLREDGPQHGYFYLQVGSPGAYTLTLSRDGFVTATMGPVTVSRVRQRLALGDLQITRILPTRTVARAVGGGVPTPAGGGKLLVTVTTRSSVRPVGEVQVREGRTVLGRGRLSARTGRVVVDLRRLTAGSHRLRAHYLGSAALEGSASSTVTVTVRRSKHRG